MKKIVYSTILALTLASTINTTKADDFVPELSTADYKEEAVISKEIAEDIQISMDQTWTRTYIRSVNPNISSEDANKIVEIVYIECEKYGFNPRVIFSQIMQESGFNPKAVGKDKDTGLMQILPSTGKEIAMKMGIENYKYEMLFDIETNIKMGMWYLNQNFERASRYTKDDDKRLRLALVAYNAGTRAFYDFKNGKYRNDYHEHVLRHYSSFEI